MLNRRNLGNQVEFYSDRVPKIDFETKRLITLTTYTLLTVSFYFTSIYLLGAMLILTLYHTFQTYYIKSISLVNGDIILNLINPFRFKKKFTVNIDNINITSKSEKLSMFIRIDKLKIYSGSKFLITITPSDNTFNSSELLELQKTIYNIKNSN